MINGIKENFGNARLQSTIDENYQMKIKELNDAYELIKLYEELGNGEISDEIKIKAQSYFYAANRMSWPGRINPCNVPDDRVFTCINGIKQNSTQTFLNFYKSYKNKIDKKYFEEYVNNAFRDLQVAYRLYCLVNNIEINPNISIEEISAIIEEINKQKTKE